MRFLTSSRTTVWSLYDSLLASETNNHSMIGPAPEHLLLRLLVVTSIHQSINRIELANIGRSMLRGSSIAPRASSNSRPDGGGDHGAVFDATSAVLSKLVAHFQAPNDASAAADAAALIEQRHQTVRYCQRLLESRLTPSAHLYSTDLAVKRRTSVISQRESASATDVHQVVQQGRVEQAVELSGLERAASAKQPRIAASALYVLHSLAANTTQSYSKVPLFAVVMLYHRVRH